MKTLILKDKIYQLKFGLKDLMLIEDSVFNSEQEKIKLQFHLALNSNASYTMEESQDIMESLECDPKELIDEVMRDSLGGVIDYSSSLSIQDQVEELYSLAVGQLDIDPHLFFELSPHEIELIYKGFLAKKELETNLQIIANHSKERFRIYGQSYTPSTMAKRIETFTSLGI